MIYPWFRKRLREERIEQIGQGGSGAHDVQGGIEGTGLVQLEKRRLREILLLSSAALREGTGRCS